MESPFKNSILRFLGSGRRPHRSDYKVASLLAHPIPLSKDRHPALYAQVDDVKKVEASYGFEWQLQFRVGTTPPAPRHGGSPERSAVSVPLDGTLRAEEPTFFYTLSSLNSPEQNQRNMSDFVFSQWERLASDRPETD